MTRNDTIYKVLFAISIAFVPMAMAAYLMMLAWTVALFVAGILLAKVWMEIFKNKEDQDMLLLNVVACVTTVCSLVIFFTIHGYLHVAMCVFVCVLVVLFNLGKWMFRNDIMPEMIDAVDSCYTMFECLVLGTLAFVVFYQLAANIALVALILTSFVSVVYKTYRLLKDKGVFSKFRRK